MNKYKYQYLFIMKIIYQYLLSLNDFGIEKRWENYQLQFMLSVNITMFPYLLTWNHLLWFIKNNLWFERNNRQCVRSINHCIFLKIKRWKIWEVYKRIMLSLVAFRDFSIPLFIIKIKNIYMTLFLINHFLNRIIEI